MFGGETVARIVIASQSEASRSKLSRLLSSSGFQVFRCCGAASELRRAISESEDCIVVMAGLIPDCKPDELAWDYRDSAKILLIAKQPVLDDIESREIFRLPLPVTGQVITGALEMLSQMHRMTMPHRTGDSKTMVEKAKAVLMKQKGLTEPEAHRAMQQYAMNHGMKMADFAARILESSGETEE